MPKNAVSGYCGRMSPLCDDEFTVTEGIQRGLHGALGEAGFLRDHPETHHDRSPALSRSAAKQKQINQKGRRLLIVSNEVAH